MSGWFWLILGVAFLVLFIVIVWAAAAAAGDYDKKRGMK